MAKNSNKKAIDKENEIATKIEEEFKKEKLNDGLFKAKILIDKEKKYYTVNEVALVLSDLLEKNFDSTRSNIYNAIDKGTIKGIKVIGSIRIERRSVIKLFGLEDYVS